MSNFLNNASRSYLITEQGDNFVIAKLTFTLKLALESAGYSAVEASNIVDEANLNYEV